MRSRKWFKIFEMHSIYACLFMYNKHIRIIANCAAGVSLENELHANMRSCASFCFFYKRPNKNEYLVAFLSILQPDTHPERRA